MTRLLFTCAAASLTFGLVCQSWNYTAYGSRELPTGIDHLGYCLVALGCTLLAYVFATFLASSE